MASINKGKGTLLKNKGKIKWSAGLVYCIVLLIFGFLIQNISDNWSQVLEIRVNFQPGLLSLSVLLLISYFFLLALLWELITRRVGLKLPLRRTVYYWFLSQLGKYVPGKIVFVMSRAYFYKKEGFRISITASAFLLETIAGVISLSLISLILIAPYLTRDMVYLVLVLLLVLFGLHPRMVELAVSGLNRLLGRQSVALNVRWRDWILINVLYGCNFFLLAGGAFFLFCKSIFNVNGEQALFLIGALGLSGALGMIAFFAPAGLGVREGSLFFLLSKIMPEAEAAVISISSRVWMMCSELILIAIVYGIFHSGSVFGKGEKR